MAAPSRGRLENVRIDDFYHYLSLMPISHFDAIFLVLKLHTRARNNENTIFVSKQNMAKSTSAHEKKRTRKNHSRTVAQLAACQKVLSESNSCIIHGFLSSSGYFYSALVLG